MSKLVSVDWEQARAARPAATPPDLVRLLRSGSRIHARGADAQVILNTFYFPI